MGLELKKYIIISSIKKTFLGFSRSEKGTLEYTGIINKTAEKAFKEWKKNVSEKSFINAKVYEIKEDCSLELVLEVIK